MDNKNNTLLNDFLLEIVDFIDGWLTDKGVRVKNEDRDKDNPENTTNFYGEDFDCIMEGVRDICNSNGIVVEDKWEG